MDCKCGCGGEPKVGKQFIHGHNRRDRTITPEMRAAYHREYNAKYQRDNAEKCLALRKRWDAANRDKKLATTKEWFVNHPEYKARWRELHPEADKAYALAAGPRDRKDYNARTKAQKAERTRRWAKEHPERKQISSAKRRALIKGCGGSGVSHEQWTAVCEEFGGRCAYCAEIRPLTLDHVEPVSKGGAHDIENVVPACRSCNAKKHNRTLIVWLVRRAA